MSEFGHPKIDEWMAWAATKLSAEDYERYAGWMKSLPSAAQEKMRADADRIPERNPNAPSHEELSQGVAIFESLPPAQLARIFPEHSEEEWADIVAVGRDLVEDGFAIDPELEADGDPVLQIIIKLYRARGRELLATGDS
jgi:hypothetical protein